MAWFSTYVADRDEYRLTDTVINATSKPVTILFVTQGLNFLQNQGYGFFGGQFFGPNKKDIVLRAYANGTYTQVLASLTYAKTPDPPVDVGM